jgi:hypothetical protein
MEALRVFEPDVHAAILADRDLVLQKHRFSQDGREGVHRAQLEALVGRAPEHRREVARETLKELFPQVQWAFGGTSYGASWTSRWISEKRICTDRFFGRYFELQAPEGAVAESEFVEFLSAANDLDALQGIVADLQTRGLLPDLAARLDEGVERLPVDAGSSLLPILFEVGQEVLGTRSSDPFASAWVSAWRATTWYLARLPQQERGQLVLDAFQSTRSLAMLAMLISLDVSNRKKDSQVDPRFTDDQLDRLKSAWIKAVEELAADPPRMMSQPDLLSLLYRWRDFSGSIEGPAKFVRAASQDDRWLPVILRALMTVGTAHAMGDRVARPHESFRREVLSDFFDIDELDARIARLPLDGVKEDERHAIHVLRLHLNKWRQHELDDDL